MRRRITAAALILTGLAWVPAGATTRPTRPRRSACGRAACSASPSARASTRTCGATSGARCGAAGLAAWWSTVAGRMPDANERCGTSRRVRVSTATSTRQRSAGAADRGWSVAATRAAGRPMCATCPAPRTDRTARRSETDSNASATALASATCSADDAQFAGVQPGVEHAHRAIETVGAAERSQRLPARDRPGSAHGIQGADGQLRLREGQPGLGAEPGVPARRRRLVAPRLLFERQQQERQSVGERDLWELRRERPGKQQVPAGESAVELAVGAPMRGHEHMFACVIVSSEHPGHAEHGSGRAGLTGQSGAWTASAQAREPLRTRYMP
jgi:hypothetical protein